MTIRKIGVIGAGQMGSGIAHVCALSGYDVGLYDISTDKIEEGLATINGNMARQVASEKITESDREAALSRLTPAPQMEALAAADMVIESVTEDEEIKREIFAGVRPVLKPETILASNTSSLSITRLASETAKPENFMFV